MIINNNKMLPLLLLVLFALFISAAGIFCSTRLVNLAEAMHFMELQNQAGFFKPRVASDAIMTKERLYVCNDTEVIDKVTVPVELQGLTRVDLVAKYSGWLVKFNNPKSIVLTEQSEQLCPVHKNYRHLGIFESRLAIYEGPLGCNGKIIRVEPIAVEKLPNGLQIKLQQVMDYQKQSAAALEKLRNELEFKNDEVLNAFLENLDEVH